MARHTSGRRRSDHRPSGRGTTYRGADPATPKQPGPLARPPGTPDTVVCPDCGTRVDSRPDGRPVAHQAGGYDVRGDRVRCYASGAAYAGKVDALPFKTEEQARALGLATLSMIARHYRCTENRARYLLKQRHLTPVALLDDDSPRKPPALYDVAEVLRRFPTPIQESLDSTG